MVARSHRNQIKGALGGLALSLPLIQGCSQPAAPSSPQDTGATQEEKPESTGEQPETKDDPNDSTGGKKENGKGEKKPDKGDQEGESTGQGPDGEESTDNESEDPGEKEDGADSEEVPLSLVGYSGKGDGCVFKGEKKTATVVRMKDENHPEGVLYLQVTFDELKIDEDAEAEVSNIACTVALDLKWPAGRRVRTLNDPSFFPIEHDAFFYIPAGSDGGAEIRGYQGFVGQKRDRWRHEVSGQQEGLLRFGGRTVLRSDCSGSGQWVMHFDLSARANEKKKRSRASVDQTSVVFVVETEKQSKDCAAKGGL